VGTSVGLGHLVRCWRLAEELPFEKPFVFVTRRLPGTEDAMRLVPLEQWDVRFLPPVLTIEEDANQTFTVVQDTKADLLVTDLCQQENLKTPSRLEKYHQKLSALGAKKTVGISDCRVPKLGTALTIVPYECPSDAPARSAVSDRTLLGLSFFLCDPSLHKLRANKEIVRQAENIFVCISGSDPMCVTPLVLDAIAQLTYSTIKVRVATSPAMTAGCRDGIEEAARKLSVCEVVPFSPHLSDHLAWADIAITGEGLIKYETAAAGVPTLMITQFDHDSAVIRNFIDGDFVFYAGRADKMERNKLADDLSEFLSNPHLRSRYAERGSTLIDGLAYSRIEKRIAQLFDE